MFLNYNPGLRHPTGTKPMFSLPYLLAFMGPEFPAFKRYYGDAKTAFVLLWLFGFPRTQIPPAAHPCSLRSYRWMCQPIIAWIIWVRISDLSFVRVETGGSPVFPCKPSVFDVVFDSGQVEIPCHLQNLNIAPTHSNVNASNDKSYFEIQCTPLTVAVYASCQHFYWLCKTRFQWLTKPFCSGL